MAQVTKSLCEEIIRTEGDIGLTHWERFQLAHLALKALSAAPQAEKELPEAQSTPLTDALIARHTASMKKLDGGHVVPWAQEVSHQFGEFYAHARRLERAYWQAIGALEELARQVRISGAVDDHGHKLTNLKALADADAALSQARKLGVG